MVQRDLALAKTAYADGNAELSKQAHEAKQICEPGHEGVGDIRTSCMLWGSLEGVFASLVLITVLSTSDVPVGQVVAIGISCSSALAVAFGFRDYLRFRSHRNVYERERRREAWELKNYPTGEVNEMIELYESQGVSKEDATVVITTMAKYKEVFVDLMMMAELRMQSPQGSPVKNALITTVSSMCAGLAPVLLFFAWKAYGNALVQWVPLFTHPHVIGLQCSVLATVVSHYASGRELTLTSLAMVFLFSAIVTLLSLTAGTWVSPITATTVRSLIH